MTHKMSQTVLSHLDQYRFSQCLSGITEKYFLLDIYCDFAYIARRLLSTHKIFDWSVIYKLITQMFYFLQCSRQAPCRSVEISSGLLLPTPRTM